MSRSQFFVHFTIHYQSHPLHTTCRCIMRKQLKEICMEHWWMPILTCSIEYSTIFDEVVHQINSEIRCKVYTPSIIHFDTPLTLVTFSTLSTPQLVALSTACLGSYLTTPWTRTLRCTIFASITRRCSCSPDMLLIYQKYSLFLTNCAQIPYLYLHQLPVCIFERDRER